MDDFRVSFSLYGNYGNFDKWAEVQDELENITSNEKCQEKLYKEITPVELKQIEDDKDEANTKKDY